MTQTAEQNHVPTDAKSKKAAEKAAAKEAKAAAKAAEAAPPATPPEAPFEPVLTADQKVSYRTVNLKDIIIDFQWNSRLLTRTKLDGPHPDGDPDGDKEAPGLTGLARSLAMKGQDQPVAAAVLMSGPNKGGLFLCYGFRRAMAVQKLLDSGEAVKGLNPGELYVKVYEGLNDAEMRNLNLRENVRDAIPPSDLAYGIQQQIAANPDITQKEIALTLGKGEGYVSQLKTIGQDLLPELFKAWRESATKPLLHMKVYAIAKLDKKEQKAAYKEAVEAAAPKGADSDPNAWVDGAKAKAEALGKAFGIASRLGLIKGYVEGTCTDDIRQLVKFKTSITVMGDDGEKKSKKVSITVDRAIAKAFDAGFAEGEKEPEVEEDEEEEDEE